MRKRLRKKLRLGEFQELGFEVTFQLPPGLSDAGREELLWDFLEQAIERRRLAAGGGGGPVTWSFFVCRAGRGSATQGDREAVLSWLEEDGRPLTPQVGALVDAWYGPDEAYAVRRR